MMTMHRIRILIATCLFVAAGILVLNARSASAALTSCTGGADLSNNLESATCTETVQIDWFLQVTCERAGRTVTTVNGTRQSGPGTATSIAICPTGTELGGSTLVEIGFIR